MALWILSSLAVLWTLLALVGLFTMGTMMGSRRMMGGQGMMGGVSSMMMGGMMLSMALTWAVMLGMDGMFLWLLVSSRRAV